MGWGDPFTWAREKASDLGRAAADRVASGQRWVGQKSADTAKWLAQKKADAGDWATRQADVAKESARAGMRTKADSAYDWMGEKAEARRVEAAVKRKNESFSAHTKAGSPTQSCPEPQLNANQRHDGWMMAPNCLDKNCTCAPIPPGKNATTTARSRAAVSDSACCRARRAKGEPTRDIIYVNGINTDLAAHCATLKAIAAQTCGRVVGVYTATDGFVGDAAQTSQDRRLIKQASGGKPTPAADGRNPAVDSLQRQITNELGAGRKPEIWAHSQGGAVTSLALYGARNSAGIRQGNADPLAGMTVKSMGSAAPKWPDGPAYEHYIHVNDFTPTSFGLGFDPTGDAAAGKTGAGVPAKVIRFSGDPKSPVPFSNERKLDWTPAATANHGVEETYLRMVKQVHGGC